ncbi:MAG: gamma-glutamyl-gamma-aminobutyrate hydrolase family protein [Pseudomonas sp.]
MTRVRAFAPRGIILAGGPESVHEANSPRAPQAVFDLRVPLLGICYGMQTMAEQMGGKVLRLRPARIRLCPRRPWSARLACWTASTIASSDDGVFGLDVWMSHGDKVAEMPAGFHIIASTPSCPIAAMADDARGYYGVQFHPEVTHTKQGGRILSRFVQDICGCRSPVDPVQHHRTTPSPPCVSRSATPRCCWACPAVWIPRWSRRCCTRPSATS